jgi:polyhydroxyalkanoate synthase
VWSYWVNNYLLGNKPPAFDVLAWNADSTNLPARLHADFLTIALDDALSGSARLEVLGTPIELGKVDCDAYFVGARTDHITPWEACYRSAHLLGGDKQFVLSSSGHIQALVNPPGNAKARYFVNRELPPEAESWLATATTEAGTWWEHWAGWLAERAGDRIPTRRALGSRAHPPGDVAPGVYVRG